MAFVEHTSKHLFPVFVWGKDICVKLCGAELEISATQVFEEDGVTAFDPLHQYRQAVSRYGAQKRQGKNSPHIQFANAKSDDELIRFVQHFGPLVVSSSRTQEVSLPRTEDVPGLGQVQFPGFRQILIARQDLAELRSERQIYRAALNLVSELQHRKSNITKIQEYVLEIVPRVSKWPGQWERERQLRASGQGYAAEPAWKFGEVNIRALEVWRYWTTQKSSGEPLRRAFRIDPISAGHLVICELLNAFSPIVYIWGNTPVEAPNMDLTGGIRPVLYYILRKVYLQAGGVEICRNIDCREVFEVERSGQEFCGDACSRLQRQRDYWKKTGKHLRERRLKKRKSSRS